MTSTSRTDETLSAAEADRLAQLMQALSSPVRLRILDVLSAEPRTVTAIADALGLQQSTLSNHLRLLRHLSLVVGVRDGKNVRYALADEHAAAFLEQLREHLAHW